MERCLLGTAIRFCPSITFSPRSNLSIAFGSPRPARLLYQSRRMLKTSAKSNVNSGAFEVYDIANNQLTGAASLGAVGSDWQLGGFAADPPTGSMGSSGSTSQLVQAMAGFGGSSGAADGVNTAPVGAETSQQPLLTTPQHV